MKLCRKNTARQVRSATFTAGSSMKAKDIYDEFDCKKKEFDNEKKYSSMRNHTKKQIVYIQPL
jgi:hypothetical protein